LVVSRMIWPDKPMLPGQSHSLKAWGLLLGEHKTDYGGGFDAFSQEMMDYCVQDTVVTAKIYQYQEKFRTDNEKAIAMEMVLNGRFLSADEALRYGLVNRVVPTEEYLEEAISLASEIAQRCDLTIISGDDSLTLPLASVGGKGVISVAANIVPADVKAMTDFILQGDFISARQWHKKLFNLCKNRRIQEQY